MYFCTPFLRQHQEKKGSLKETYNNFYGCRLALEKS